MNIRNSTAIAIVFFLLGIGANSFAQGRFTISTGLAVTEGLNVGLRYGWNQSQVGVTVGTFPFYEVIANPSNGETVVAASFYHHIYGEPRRGDRKPWFYKTGLSYMHAKETDVVFRKLTLNFLVGKEFYITDRFGLQICAGVAFMARSVYEDDGEVYEYTEDDPWHPAGEISFFYHLGK
jgi:hypothetical protein